MKNLITIFLLLTFSSILSGKTVHVPKGSNIDDRSSLDRSGGDGAGGVKCGPPATLEFSQDILTIYVLLVFHLYNFYLIT